MRGQPKDVPVSDGVAHGPGASFSKTYKDPEIGKLSSIPSVTSAVSSSYTEGKPFLLKIRDSLLSPFTFFFKVKTSTKTISKFSGKRAEAITSLHRGRPWGWKRPKDKPSDIHLPATIREALRNQKYRPSDDKLQVMIKVEDIREKIRLYKAPITMVLVVDLSGSMILSLEEAKAALLRLHRDAYRYRDKVGIVALKDTKAEIVQHPITNLGVVANRLTSLKMSSFTPLADGMLKAYEVLQKAKRRDKSVIPVMILVTDGNANVPLHRSVETGEPRHFSSEGIIVRSFEDLAFKDALAVAKIIKKEGIQTIIVNTNVFMAGRSSYGSTVTKVLAAATDGSHHQIDKLSEGKERVDEIFWGIKQDQKKIIRGEALKEVQLWR
jgi:magnesium chelatase subunit D